MSGKLFWKEPLIGVVENSVFKFLKNNCDGVLLNSFYVKSKII